MGQILVNPKPNLIFARGLRSILRHEPDIIMVGEIRHLETVEIAIQASLTGHLVFSTLHTNDEAGADSVRIKEEAVEAGMCTLFEDGIRKVGSGATSLDEVIRVTQE